MSQLTEGQRYTIGVLINRGETQTKIADYIGCHKSTICRELKRNVGTRGIKAGIYDYHKAQAKTNQRHWTKNKSKKFTLAMKQYIWTKLREDRWSPEIIGVKGLEKFGEFVSTETIYQWIWAMKKSNKKCNASYKSLHKYLKHDKRRQKRANSYQNRGCIPQRCSIEQRPALVEKRQRLGDMEVDLVMGKNHKPGLLVITDRVSLYTKLRKIKTKSSKYIAQAIKSELNSIQIKPKTLTYDNDLAFAAHQEVNALFGVKSYFTRPYTAQDKGTIENRIGILRRFFPKKTDFTTISAKQIKIVENKLNARPVRKFSYLSPDEFLFNKLNVAFIT